MNGTSRCQDGVCRSECLRYQGCPQDKNFHCGNGLCARTQGDCAGDSVCPHSGFRCIDNSCVQDQSLCSIPLRSFVAELLQITVSSLSTTIVEFIQKGYTSIKLGKITLPAGALLYNSTLNDTNGSNISMNSLGVLIRPVAESIIRELTTKIHQTKKKLC